MGKADGESLQEFKMPEERDELFLATSKTRTKTIEKIKKKKRPESGIIKNFLVACGVLTEGAAVINMSFLLLLAFGLKVRPVV